jgi:hypothetical protein
VQQTTIHKYHGHRLHSRVGGGSFFSNRAHSCVTGSEAEVRHFELI